MDYFDRQRLKVIVFLEEFLRSKRGTYARVNPWGPDALDKLGPYIRTGKMLRSGLVAVGAGTGRRPAAGTR